VKRYRDQTSGRLKLRSGRLRILLERDIRVVLRLIDKDPFISNKTLIKEVGLTCSVRTLTRELI